MVQADRLSDDDRRRLNDRHETLLRSMIMLSGDRVSAAQLGQIVERATDAATPKEARHTAPPVAAINRLQHLLVETVEADAKKRPTNIYSAEGARAEQTGRTAMAPKSGIDVDRLEQSRFSYQKQQDAAVESSGAADRSGSSGARYDGMNSSDWSSPAGMAKMRDLAIHSGLPWAANNTELLRLGPAAIGALAEVHFKQEAYKRLTSDASFKAKEIVTLARFAKREHIDANHLAGVMAHGVKTLAGNDIPERRKLDTAFAGYMEHPEKPETKQHLFKALDPYADDPKKKPEVYRMLDAVRIKREEFDAAHRTNGPSRKAAEVKQEEAKGKEAKAGTEAKKVEVKVASFDALPDDPPKAKTESSKPSEKAAQPAAPKKLAAQPPAANQPKPA